MEIKIRQRGFNSTAPAQELGIVAPQLQRAQGNLNYHTDAIRRSPMLRGYPSRPAWPAGQGHNLRAVLSRAAECVERRATMSSSSIRHRSGLGTGDTPGAFRRAYRRQRVGLLASHYPEDHQ
jgi:hypothetical protein